VGPWSILVLVRAQRRYRRVVLRARPCRHASQMPPSSTMWSKDAVSWGGGNVRHVDTPTDGSRGTTQACSTSRRPLALRMAAVAKVTSRHRRPHPPTRPSAHRHTRPRTRPPTRSPTRPPARPLPAFSSVRCGRARPQRAARGHSHERGVRQPARPADASTTRPRRNKNDSHPNIRCAHFPARLHSSFSQSPTRIQPSRISRRAQDSTCRRQVGGGHSPVPRLFQSSLAALSCSSSLHRHL